MDEKYRKIAENIISQFTPTAQGYKWLQMRLEVLQEETAEAALEKFKQSTGGR